jgi:hypothetical protein
VTTAAASWIGETLYPIPRNERDFRSLQGVEALGDALRPLALITKLRRDGDTGTVAGDAGGQVNLLPVAAGRAQYGFRDYLGFCSVPAE